MLDKDNNKCIPLLLNGICLKIILKLAETINSFNGTHPVCVSLDVFRNDHELAALVCAHDRTTFKMHVYRIGQTQKQRCLHEKEIKVFTVSFFMKIKKKKGHSKRHIYTQIVVLIIFQSESSENC